MRKWIAASAFIVVIALLVIAFFYVYSRTGDVFPSSNADLIILSEHGKKEIKIKDRQNVKDMLDILNQGKQVKLTKSVSPDPVRLYT